VRDLKAACLTKQSKPWSTIRFITQKQILLSTTACLCFLAPTSNAAAAEAADNAVQTAPVITAAATSSDTKTTSESDTGPTAGTAAAEVENAAGEAAEDVAEDIAISTAATLQSDIDVYAVEFFDQYTPQNAFEMIRRLPGFSFDRGSNVRGFGGAAGNVLIDGSRPTSKAGGLESALKRIPAAQVERIEILRGGISAGEAAGQSVVANVIRKQDGSSGTWAVKFRRAQDGRILPNIEFGIASKLGAWDTSFDIDIGAAGGNRSALVRDLDADGLLLSSSRERRNTGNKWLFVSGEGSRPLAGGKLTLNGRIGGNNWHGDTTRDGYIGHLPNESPRDNFWILGQKERFREAELGIDWAKTYANQWKWRLITLATGNNDKFSSDFAFEDLLTDDTSQSYFLQDATKTEFIARTTYGKSGTSKFKPEFGVELANNKLDTELEFFENGVEVQLDSASVVVDEIRGEAFATFVYQIAKKLSLDGGITAEASQIKVSGDATQKQTFKFIKPRLSATYSFNDNTQLTLEAERQIGQLNFSNFAASSQAQDDRTTAGNPDLKPDKTTSVTGTLDWKFSERGSLKLKGFYEWRSDILEQIILPSGGQGRGNAGNARFYGFRAEANVPLDAVLKGGLIEITYRHNRSSFADPIIGGDTRRISWYTPSWLSFEFRQDITKHKFAWGVEYWGSFADQGFLVDEIQRVEGNKRLRIFAETTRFFGVKMRLEVTEANTGRYTRTRFFFDGDRSGDFLGSEISDRKNRPRFRFDISGTF